MAAPVGKSLRGAKLPSLFVVCDSSLLTQQCPSGLMGSKAASPDSLLCPASSQKPALWQVFWNICQWAGPVGPQWAGRQHTEDGDRGHGRRPYPTDCPPSSRVVMAWISGRGSIFIITHQRVLSRQRIWFELGFIGLVYIRCESGEMGWGTGVWGFSELSKESGELSKASGSPGKGVTLWQGCRYQSSAGSRVFGKEPWTGSQAGLGGVTLSMSLHLSGL